MLKFALGIQKERQLSGPCLSTIIDIFCRKISTKVVILIDKSLNKVINMSPQTTKVLSFEECCKILFL